MNSFESGFVKVTWNQGHLKVTCVMTSKKMRQQNNVIVVNAWTMKSFSLSLIHSQMFIVWEFVSSFLTVPAKELRDKYCLYLRINRHISEPRWIELDSYAKCVFKKKKCTVQHCLRRGRPGKHHLTENGWMESV